GVEYHVTFHFLHGLVNVSVQHSHRTKFLQVAKRLRAIISAPAPLRINAPQRYVSKHYDGRAFGKMFYVFLHPLKLFLAQTAQPAGFQVQRIDQPNEVNAAVIKAVPARALRFFAVALKVLLAIVADYVMLTRNVEN